MKHWDDQQSWKKFFEIYRKLIDGVARKSGLSPEDARDAVQETVVSVCKAMGGFEADPRRGSFKAWLLTITRSRIIDQQRKRRRKPAPALPIGEFPRLDLLVGCRFKNQRGEIALGALNITGEDYPLRPVNLSEELPRERVFYARLRLRF